MLTLGCARNEVDSEELAGRLVGSGWELAEAESAEVIVVNTCGFVEQAKKDSVDTLLAAADTGAKVVAVGCMAERYGKELADSMPEAAAVLGFDEYPELADRLDEVLHGKAVESHVPVDRRTLLPISPVQRQENDVVVPGHGWGPRVLRTRLDDSPVAALKIASGCDRRCTFCAIPSFRGAFVSRTPDEIVAEAQWLVDNGARELFLVSENSTSYGKDLRDASLENVLQRLAAKAKRVRVSYLQPAEMRPSLVKAIATTPGVADYFDLSFQHGSGTVLRRMRRFGGCDDFLQLTDQIRQFSPRAGIRTNVIVGFPGETEADVAELERFLVGARMDAVGVFGYSDEEGTEAAGFDDKHDEDTVAERVARISALVEELTTQRAEERVGDEVVVMVEQDDDEYVGRAAHQAPEVDGECVVDSDIELAKGDFVRCVVEGSEGVDLLVRALEVL
ncbi:30S ribosomal protein S12 methylthiotransferase RimO [Actinocrispum wychmicini]|uniref:Ribosomal protein uS12 methylthiotransferase RimO n=1 Tax=Actinocrispum wychmicini TaxID=1213861 RepID=A0A4V2S6S2_9PSEU|nr:30S ribosomal protein S12 methylthiotransferase RimO [Actinocrispum wychmicini]TCO56700.1 ribosomal protein S12 methylthiotransferase RimO [Actinocrispum wychmicini]